MRAAVSPALVYADQQEHARNESYFYFRDTLNNACSKLSVQSNSAAWLQSWRRPALMLRVSSRAATHSHLLFQQHVLKQSALPLARAAGFCKNVNTAAHSDAHLIRSPHPDVVIPNCLLHEYLAPHKQCPRDREARPAFVECFTGASVTHGEVAENAFNCSERLSSELMLKRGDVVALFSLNDVNYFSILLGCMKAGIIVTTVDPDYDANELTQQLKHAQAKALLLMRGTATHASFAVETSSQCTMQAEQFLLIIKGEDAPHMMGIAQAAAGACGISLFTIAQMVHPDVVYAPVLQGLWAAAKDKLGAASRKTVPTDTALLPYMFRGQNYRPSSHPDDPLVPVEPIARTEPDAPPRGCMLSHSSLVANLCQIEEPEGRHVSIGVTGESLLDR
eukprot:4239-Heterococcus_DN1.PRE.4